MLDIDASVIVIFLLVWILLFILTKVFFNPLRKVMRERDKQILENRQSAEKAFEKYEKSIREIEESLKTARTASYATRDQFEKDALKEKERMIAEVTKELRSQVDGAKTEMDERIAKLKLDLEKISHTLAKDIEKKILE
jgi:F-type H+-transporting ATPase subunit b